MCIILKLNAKRITALLVFACHCYRDLSYAYYNGQHTYFVSSSHTRHSILSETSTQDETTPPSHHACKSQETYDQHIKNIISQHITIIPTSPSHKSRTPATRHTNTPSQILPSHVPRPPCSNNQQPSHLAPPQFLRHTRPPRLFQKRLRRIITHHLSPEHGLDLGRDWGCGSRCCGSDCASVGWT